MLLMDCTLTLSRILLLTPTLALIRRSCFGDWWRWQQRQAGRATGRQCPVCRAPISATALAHSPSTLSLADSKQQKADGGRSRNVDDVQDNAWLTAEDMARLRVSQRRWGGRRREAAAPGADCRLLTLIE